MYGLRVHEAVIRSGEIETRVTVHLINENYDEGPILQQRSMPLYSHDTAESLQQVALELEYSLYSDTVSRIAKGEIVLPGN